MDKKDKVSKSRANTHTPCPGEGNLHVGQLNIISDYINMSEGFYYEIAINKDYLSTSIDKYACCLYKNIIVGYIVPCTDA